MLKKTQKQAVVALPFGVDQVTKAAERRWLGKARLQWPRRSEELLSRVLSVLDLPPPEGGIAALRLWGQTGERPGVRVAAADPVYLEARMDHVCLHALSPDELPVGDVRGVFDLLQTTLGSSETDGHCAFTSIGALGYLRSEEHIATADVSPETADGASPDVFLPEGAQAASHDRLESEVQMCLHEAEVNRRRMESGARPINSLWLWGGGIAPPEIERDLPPLFAEDPVLRGYWTSSSARIERWPGSLGACLDAAGDGFVAVVPGTEVAASHLEALRSMLSAGRLHRAFLLFRGGLLAEARRADRFRFWRGRPRPAAGSGHP